MTGLHAAVIQISPRFGDTAGNTERALDLVPRDCGLAVLPELFASGYQFRSREEAMDLAEDPAQGPAPVCEQLAAFAAEHGTTIVAGLAERSADRLYNSSVLIRPDGSREIYRKVHLFWDEKDIFDPGDRGFPVFSACGTRVGMMVCYDWMYPESARSLALGGAAVIAHPANLVLPWCPEAMITRARENRVHCLTANRIGNEERTGSRLDFIGMSQLVSATGTLLDRMDAGSEGAATAVLDISELDRFVTPRNDVWADRRPDQYRS